MIQKWVIAATLLFSLQCQANSVDIDLLWNACIDPASTIVYCHTINDYKEKQIETLEFFFNQNTTNWERNALTIIYYGVSQKFVLEHKFDKGPKGSLFFKTDEYKFVFTWDW